MNITISALLYIINGKSLSFKIINFFTNIAISLFIDGLMQCTSKPTDIIQSYQPLFVFYLRIGISVILSISIMSFSYNLSRSPLILACTIFLITIFYKYLKVGYRTYRNSFSKSCFLVLITIFLSACITILNDFYSSDSESSLTFIAAISFLVMVIINRNKSTFTFN